MKRLADWNGCMRYEVEIVLADGSLTKEPESFLDFHEACQHALMTADSLGKLARKAIPCPQSVNIRHEGKITIGISVFVGGLSQARG